MLNTFDFDTLRDEGCIQCEHEVLRQLWPHLVHETKGDPCSTGCPAYNGGMCKVYQKYSRVVAQEKRTKQTALRNATTPHNGSGDWAGMTMKQIATKEGISLGEARRRKQEGRYG